MANLKELLTKPLPQNDTSRSSIQLLAGGYVIYLAYTMVRDTLNGVSEMSMTVTVITAVLMALCGAGINAVAVRTLKRVEKEEKAAQAEREAARAAEEDTQL